MTGPSHRRGGIVVVGASLAGFHAVEALRQFGYDGPLTLVGDEPALPYDRPPLSKEVLVGTREPDATTLRDEAHFRARDVELRLGARATGVDLAAQELLIGAERLPFAKLVIATGASARGLPGLEGYENTFLLRTQEDARALRAALRSAGHVAVVGAGVIGCEVAASARSLGLDVTMIEAAPHAMSRALGAELGSVCAQLHTDRGSDVRCGVVIERVDGGHRVERLQLSDGSTVEPDVVVVGIGVTPNTDWLRDSGLALANGVTCDAALQTAHPAVVAVGDVANWPNPFFGVPMRAEQWTTAIEQARHVARNLVRDEALPYHGSNYFWSDQHGARIQFVGSPDADERVVVDGSFEEGRVLCLLRGEDRLVGAFAINAPKRFMATKQLVARGATWDDALEGVAA